MMRAKELKARELEEVKDLLRKYSTISIADLTSLPSPTLQKLRKKLQDKIFIKVTKKSLISLAIDQVKEKDLTGLKPSLENSIPALVLGDQDPFKLYKLIKENKSNALAKPGQVSPRDIIIQAGPTNFPPGPIIGELGSVGLQTGVEAGKIVIKNDKLIVKANEVIKQEIAAVLSKLGIEPIEIGLNIVASYKDTIVYDKSSLDIDEEIYINNLRLANAQALKLAEVIGFISKNNIKLLLKKAYLISLNLANKFNLSIESKFEKIEIEETKEIKTHEKETIKSGFVGYDEDVVKKAQSLLQDLQDQKIKEQEKPKFKSMWD